MNLGGINEPIIGQRKVHQDVRLREGEVSLLGGLLTTQDTKSKSGFPGLASIPIIGKLFSGQNIDRERDEIMVAMIPHVVRRPDITPENLRGVASGTQNTVSVRRSPRVIEPDLQPPAPSANNAAPGGPPDGGLAKPAVQPVPAPTPVAIVPVPAQPLPQPVAPPVMPQPVPVPPPPVPAAVPSGLMPPATAPPETPAGTPAAPAAAPAAAPKPGGPVKIHFSEEKLDKHVGETFTVSVEVNDAKDVVSAPFLFQYDPKLLSLDGVTFGKFWSPDGEEPLLVKNVQNESGLASIRLNRKPGTPSVSGSGTLLTITLKALAAGTASFNANNITLDNSQTQMVGSGRPTLTVNIK